jgi:anti-sigma B factor antagonist
LGFGRQDMPSDGHRKLTGVDTTRSSSLGARRAGSTPAAAPARPQPFGVEVQQRDDVVIVRPRGELDLATVETLSAALDGIDRSGRVVLDLRGLSFIDSTGLRLLVALYRQSERDGFALLLVAPEAPVDRAIQLSGLDQALPFVSPVEAVDSESAWRRSGDSALRRVSDRSD